MSWFSKPSDALSDENAHKLRLITQLLDSDKSLDSREFDFIVEPVQFEFLLDMFSSIVTKYGYMPSFTASIEGYKPSSFKEVQVSDNIRFIQHEAVVDDKTTKSAIALSSVEVPFVLVQASIVKA